MTHQIDNQLFKYATKEDIIGLLNFVKKLIWIDKIKQTQKINIQSKRTKRIRT